MRRPNGAPFRPVLSFRVEATIYEALRTAADQSGRSIAEEAALRLRQSLEPERRIEEAKAMAAQALKLLPHPLSPLPEPYVPGMTAEESLLARTMISGPSER